MKFLPILILSCMFMLTASAQKSLSNTKWLVHTEIPGPGNNMMDFKQDSCFVFNEAGEQIGLISFVQRNDSLFVQKLSGTSPCPVASKGWYKIEWLENGEKFILHVLNDECEARSRVYTHLTIVKKIN